LAHKRRRTYDEMKLAHRERLVAYMRDLDRVEPNSWSVGFSALRQFMHSIGAPSFIVPILFDLMEEGLIWYAPPLVRGGIIYFTPGWRESASQNNRPQGDEQ